MLVERLSEDKLTKEEWTFYAFGDHRKDGLKVSMNKYVISSRKTTRHMFRPVKTYEGNRPGDTGRDRIRKEDIITPDDVFTEVKERIMNNIVFD